MMESLTWHRSILAGGKKRGDCYVEHTATAACTEGWEADDFDSMYVLTFDGDKLVSSKKEKEGYAE